jgi:hypothetical protein
VTTDVFVEVEYDFLLGDLSLEVRSHVGVDVCVDVCACAVATRVTDGRDRVRQQLARQVRNHVCRVRATHTRANSNYIMARAMAPGAYGIRMYEPMPAPDNLLGCNQFAFRMYAQATHAVSNDIALPMPTSLASVAYLGCVRLSRGSVSHSPLIARAHALSEVRARCICTASSTSCRSTTARRLAARAARCVTLCCACCCSHVVFVHRLRSRWLNAVWCD